MTEQTLKDTEYWIAGAESASLGGHKLEHVVMNAAYPLGRYTRDPRQAWEWAHEDALHFNQTDQANGAEDWVAAIWPGVPTIEQAHAEPVQ